MLRGSYMFNPMGYAVSPELYSSTGFAPLEGSGVVEILLESSNVPLALCPEFDIGLVPSPQA